MEHAVKFQHKNLELEATDHFKTSHDIPTSTPREVLSQCDMDEGASHEVETVQDSPIDLENNT